MCKWINSEANGTPGNSHKGLWQSLHNPSAPHFTGWQDWGKYWCVWVEPSQKRLFPPRGTFWKLTTMALSCGWAGLVLHCFCLFERCRSKQIQWGGSAAEPSRTTRDAAVRLLVMQVIPNFTSLGHHSVGSECETWTDSILFRCPGARHLTPPPPPPLQALLIGQHGKTCGSSLMGKWGTVWLWSSKYSCWVTLPWKN